MLKRGLLLILLLLSVSCSRLNVALSLADDFFVHEIDKYFDLTSTQSEKIENDFDKVLLQIRKDLFPEVATKLNSMAQAVEDRRYSQTEFEKDFQWGLELFQKMGLYFEKPTLEFLSQVEKNQIDHFEKQMAKKLAKDEEKFGTSEKAFDKSLDLFEKWISYTIDNTNREQDQKIRQFLIQNPFPYQLRQLNQKHVTDQLIKNLRKKDNLPSFISQWLRNRNEVSLSEFTEAQNKYRSQLRKFVFELYQSTDDAQKANFVKNLRKFSAEFDKNKI